MKTKHGGKRKGAGRKPSPYRVILVSLAFVDEAEYKRFLKNTTTRERVVKILESK